MPARRQGRRGGRPRLRRGEAIAAGSALALLGLTFVTWYGAHVSGQVGGIELEGAAAGGNAWQALSVTPLLLAVAIATALAAAGLRLVGSRRRPAIAPGAAVAVLGGLATLLVLFRILVPPDLGRLGGIEVTATPQLGAFLGLAAAFGIACGGYRAMGEEGSSFAAVAAALEKPSR